MHAERMLTSIIDYLPSSGMLLTNLIMVCDDGSYVDKSLRLKLYVAVVSAGGSLMVDLEM